VLCTRLLVLTLLAMPVLVAGAPPVDRPEPVGWIQPGPANSLGVERAVPASEGLAVRRSLIVRPNVQAIARKPGELSIALPSGSPLRVKVKTFDAREGIDVDDAGNIVVNDNPYKVSYFWYGQAGATHVFITVERGLMNALIYSPQLRVSMQGEQADRAVMRDLRPEIVDQGRCAADIVDPPVRVLRPKEELVKPDAMAADPEVYSPLARPKHSAYLTVMIYYTNEALAQFPGAPNATPPQTPYQQLDAAATALVDQMNQALTNSEESYYIRFNRVGGATLVDNTVAYIEQPVPAITNPNTRFSNHLNWLRTRDNPGTPNNAGLARRDTLGADIAILLVNDVGEPNAAPIPMPVYGAAITQKANCFGDVNCQPVTSQPGIAGPAAFRGFAHGVVSINPVVQNLTFAHELGHILGGVHDINSQSGSTQGYRPYSYGYRIPEVARDIMADPECIPHPVAGNPDICTSRLPQYSNPLALFPSGQPSGTAAQHDVVRTMRELAEGTGSMYPIDGPLQTAPDLFWNGFEF